MEELLIGNTRKLLIPIEKGIFFLLKSQRDPLLNGNEIRGKKLSFGIENAVTF